MIIESLDLKNFRNYENLSIEFDSNTNIFYGDNAQGKTNILEAIYIAATTKSHRIAKDKEVIEFGNNEAHIKLVVDKCGLKYRIDMHIKKDKAKGIAVNGVPIKKASELLGIMNVVFFSPEDLDIIKEGPVLRRRFIDMELCQLNKSYLFNLTNYNKVLNQRNKLLKELWFDEKNKDTLSVWNYQLVKYGTEVIRQREIFINELNSIIYNIHKSLSGDKEELSVKYEPSVSADSFEKTIMTSLDKDIKFKSTSYGPHRDDINFLLNGIDVRKYGSQGQKRTVALSLKLSEIEFVKNTINDKPILLLDDVLSELDSTRQNLLLNSIDDVQTIITCTGIDEFVNNRFNINKIFKVVKGTVVNEN